MENFLSLNLSETSNWNFQKIVICVAIVVLIISLVIIGHHLRKDSLNVLYPPVIANCPDYWEQEERTDNSIKCINKKKLGKPNTVHIKTFDEPMWKGYIGNCTKATWAEENDLTWDGLTNNPNVCNKPEDCC